MTTNLRAAHLPNIAATLACDCGHDNERHGPEAGGCIECRCDRVDPASRKRTNLNGGLNLLGIMVGNAPESEHKFLSRELLDMLGLISGGNITDDFTRVIELDRPDAKGPGARSLYSLEERGDAKAAKSTAPLALRELAPAPVVVKAKPDGTANLLAASKAREKPCGTPAAKKRHRRRGEDCATCAPVKLTDPKAAERKREARRKAGVKPRGLQPCGTEAANKRHKENGEPVCDPCKAARRKADQRRSAARRAA